MAVPPSALPAQAFPTAPRIHRALTAPAERRILGWLARRIPARITPDHLTLLGFAAQLAAGLFYALARHGALALLAVNLCLILNWLGDSLDGTLARVRDQQRPRYGFYVDHITDILGAVALMTGMACSGFLHWSIALAMLIGFLLLAAESFLAACTLHSFQLSAGIFGPTELRLLLVAGNFALLRSPYADLFGHRMLLFDLGGSIGCFCMTITLLALATRHTRSLYRQEPLPAPASNPAGPVTNRY